MFNIMSVYHKTYTNILDCPSPTTEAFQTINLKRVNSDLLVVVKIFK